MSSRLLLLLASFFALSFSGCESDPSKDNAFPGTSVPIRPPRSPGAEPLQLEARLDGRYVETLRIDAGSWSATAPGQQISLTFRAIGMNQVKQFKFILQAEPADAFDLAATRFSSIDPFLAPGIDLPAAGQVETGAAILGDRQVSGESVLGTLTLTTGPAFDVGTHTQVRVIFFSIGPNSNSRDEYGADALQLGVVLNAP